MGSLDSLPIVGGLFEQPNVPAPQAIPGLEWLAPLLQQLSQGLSGQVQRGVTGAQSSLNPFLQALTSGFPAFQEGLSTGFTPNVLPQLRESLMPELELAQKHLTGQTLGTAASLGTLTGSGTTQAVAQGNAGLEAGLLSQLGQVGAQAGLQGQQIRGQLAGQAAPSITGATGNAIANTQMQGPLQILQAIISGISGLPLYQPRKGPSKFETLLGPAAQIGSAAVGNPSFFK